MTEEIRTYREGLLIRHPTLGPGKILTITGDKAMIYFRDFVEVKSGDSVKPINTAFVKLEILGEQSDPFLDNLPPFINGKFSLKKPRLTMTQAISMFTRKFPLGFMDPGYFGDRATGERAYKLEAHERWNTTLGGCLGSDLLKSGQIGRIIERALSVESLLNLLSLYEKAAFRDGLKDESAAKPFFSGLFSMLEAERPTQPLFEIYLESLTHLPAAEGKTSVTKWPILTLFPYIAAPDKFMFLKPDVTKDCADRLAFDLHYDAKLNWTTYEYLLTMCATLMTHLKPLGARDYIDLQSFIYVVGHAE